MNTNIRKNLFKYMIILHIVSMLLYIPATGAGYRTNILYDILCAAVIILEIVVCRKDERHEVFWILYIGVLILGIASIHMSISPDHFAGAWEYFILFLGAPVIYICFGKIRQINVWYFVIEAAAFILLGYLLFITVRRLMKKRSVKQ